MEIKNKIILVDMDGVIADYEEELIRRWNERNPNKKIELDQDRTEFRTEHNFPEELQKEMREITLEPDFFHSLKPIKGGIDGIKELAKHNEVFICTSPQTRNEHCMQGKLSFIKKHLAGDWLRKTIITKDKTLVQADFLIDDNPDIRGVSEPTWEHILYDQPYNRHITNKKRMTWDRGIF